MLEVLSANSVAPSTNVRSPFAHGDSRSSACVHAHFWNSGRGHTRERGREGAEWDGWLMAGPGVLEYLCPKLLDKRLISPSDFVMLHKPQYYTMIVTDALPWEHCGVMH